MYKILVFDRGFSQIPIARSGILKIPSGSTLCPWGRAKAEERRFAALSGLRSAPRARRAARGDFQNPRTGDDLGKSPIKNLNFV